MVGWNAESPGTTMFLFIEMVCHVEDVVEQVRQARIWLVLYPRCPSIVRVETCRRIMSS